MQSTLFLTLEYPPIIGGVSFYYKNLFSRINIERVWIVDNSKNQLLFKNRFLWPKWLKALFLTTMMIRKYKIRKLVIGQILPLGTVSLFIHFFLHIPYIIMTHAMDVMLPFEMSARPRKRFLAKIILKHAQYVTTVSKFTLKKLLEFGVSEKKVILLPPAPTITPQDYQNLSTTTTVCPIKNPQPLILSVGRLVARKGVDKVINVLPNLVRDYPNLQYVIIGEGAERIHLETLVRQKKLEKYVIFQGNCAKEKLAMWYQKCDFFVLPTSDNNVDVEGFCIVFLEAGSFAKPVIAGLGGGVGDAVIDGQTGLLVDGGDGAMLEKAMRRLIEDSVYATALGKNAQSRIKKEFSWEKRAQQLELLLNK